MYISTANQQMHTVRLVYGAPFVKILYQTDLAQKLLSLHIFSYICAARI